MSDPVKKFFEKDLTEAEEEALSGTLASSEDAAEEFLAIAEKNYYRHGHPKPSWPETLSSPIGKKKGFKPFNWVLALGLLGGVAYWMGWGHHASLSSEGIAAGEKAPSTDLAPGAGGAGLEKGTVPLGQRTTQAAKEERVPVKDLTIEEEVQRDLAHAARGQAQGQAPVGARERGAQSPKPAGYAPVNLAESPGRTFSDIAVRVNQAEAGKVVVRVLDMSDLEVVPLYSGELAPGQWVFEWDGNLPGGGKASPGIYQVEVRSGSYANRKNVRIR